MHVFSLPVCGGPIACVPRPPACIPCRFLIHCTLSSTAWRRRNVALPAPACLRACLHMAPCAHRPHTRAFRRPRADASRCAAVGREQPSACSRDQQILELRRFNQYAQQSPADLRCWDVGLKLATGPTLTIRTFLPDRFPFEAPIMQILERSVAHPWLDSSQRIVGSRELNSWSPASNLGNVGT